MAKTISSLTVPRSYSPFRQGISQTQAINFMQCRQKWLLYINGYSAPSSEDVDFGTAFHFLLEQLYKYGGIPQNETVQTFLTKLKEEFHNTPSDPQAFENAVGMANVVFLAYLSRYQNDLTGNTVLMCEKDITVRPISKGDVARRIKIDLAYEDINGHVWLMEHKTKGRIDIDAIQFVLSMDFQALHYVTTLEDYLGKPVRGVIYNIIRTPQLRRNKEETLQAFCSRIQADIEMRPDFYFVRLPMEYTDKNKKDFQQGIWKPCTSDICRCMKDKSLIYKNSNACIGRYTCQYLEACAKNDLSVLVKVKREK